MVAFKKKLSSLGEEYGLDILAKDLINNALKGAGKSKDELIQILGREIGLAWAAVLKDPLEKLIDNKSLQITIKLVSHDEEEETSSPKKKKQAKTSTAKKTTKKTTKKKTTKK